VNSEKVVDMLVLSLLMVGLMISCLAVLWPWSDGSSRAGATKRAAATVESPHPPPDLESLEGVLVRQLVAGEITRGQYLHAMVKLAVRDDERHPLSVPPDGGEPGPGA
jgi:hypothetical protein